jgi:hypothetical protein
VTTTLFFIGSHPPESITLEGARFQLGQRDGQRQRRLTQSAVSHRQAVHSQRRYKCCPHPVTRLRQRTSRALLPLSEHGRTAFARAFSEGRTRKERGFCEDPNICRI